MDITFLATLTNWLLFGQAIINFVEANQSHAELVKFLWCWIPNCSSERRDESSHGQHVDSCPQSVAETQPAGQDPCGGHHLVRLGLSIQVASLQQSASEFIDLLGCIQSSDPGSLSQSHQNFQAIGCHAFGLPPSLSRKKMTVLKWIVRSIYSLGLLNICSCAFH